MRMAQDIELFRQHEVHSSGLDDVNLRDHRKW